jgi:signal transduction histidine kinase
MPQHALVALTISERLEQLEVYMTVVHEAITRLAERIDLIEEAVVSRDKSHLDAVEAQIDRADNLLGQLRDEARGEAGPTNTGPIDAETPPPDPSNVHY